MPTSRPQVVAMFRELSAMPNPTYVLSDDLRLVSTNRAWTEFAQANGGEAVLARWGHGTPVLDAIAGELRDFYRQTFERVLGTGERWEHDYECSSADALRIFRMLVYPVKPFLVVTSSLRIERPHDRSAHAPTESEYRHEGLIRMCAGCRRVRAVEEPERWDWVPELVRALPAMTSHGLCPPCARSYGFT